ncbi:hypothetical protein Patl1_21276 [Pistacia atlantica]|uniref:Uncharacterized protein n=1 Tax=Pistacia atlantica TaxID=434234 RepID=A0ACC1BIJ9_9ROSI|nr:hypothetical protein Patl1_21276 [Pistacia atlantica]
MLSELAILYIGANNFSGSLPPELGNLSNLEQLCMGTLRLSSPLPSELGGLLTLNLHDSRLHGKLVKS